MRRGSALLIVLGIMSFMVVSAVAFSVFMRQNRLPSSFLRQRVTSAQLAKAALAGAMRRIDACIGDDPYPGVRRGQDNQNGNQNPDQQDKSKNRWRNRVLLGEPNEGGVDESETVATLCLEALAYLPPPLVDTVRYWSRKTPTAQWASLGYDAGRYAFTAVNVSDYFDVNRIRAGAMRNSSAEGRISLGFLFENAQHTGDGPVSPASFDAFVNSATNDEFRTRFVSLADYNLALGAKGSGSGFTSPFWDYIEKGSKDGSFYGASTDNARRQKFVTDSWYPGTNTTSLVLTDDDAQPLDGFGSNIKLDSLLTRTAGGSSGFQELVKHLNLAELAALVDYIDEDNKPLSLALPTAERVPMLTGLQIVPFGLTPTFEIKEIEGETVPATPTTPEQKWMYRIWSLKSLGGNAKLMGGGSAVFPFKRKSGLSESSSFPVEVLVKMFVSTANDDFSKTRSSVSYRPTSADWGGERSDANTGVWTFRLTGRIPVKHGYTEQDALCPVELSAVNLELGDVPNQVFAIKYNQNDKTQYSPDFTKVDRPLKFRTTDGKVKDVKQDLNPGAFPDLKLNFYVWAKVLDGNNTVDLVPARIADDQLYNGIQVPAVSTDRLGEPRDEPLMPMEGAAFGVGTAVFTPTKEGFETPGDAKGLRVYCNDPRYNWAPEDWYWAGDEATISPETWKNNANLDGTDCRPFDFFQFVSNEDYLQSMGELQFLPLVRSNYGDYSEGNPISGTFFGGIGRYDGQPLSQRQNVNALANRTFMWKTRWAFGPDADWRTDEKHNPYKWGILDTNGGATVSPYADRDLLMAAFANTPYDWIVASENTSMTLAQGRKYCFSPASTEANVSWEDLLKIADGVKNEFLNSGGGDWEQVYRNADGWDSNNGIFGTSLQDFHDVDRKFLFSFWRNCLGNTPQLFLVFVRAEPSVMGSSLASHTPSQLGARAVALVWREAVSTVDGQSSAGKPHRMRILFYHQFE